MSLSIPELQKSADNRVDLLVERLRLSGTALNAESLSSELGFEPEFVQQVLDALTATKSPERRSYLFWKTVSRALSQFWEKSKAVWIWATSSPFAFVVVSTLIGYSVNWIAASPWSQTPDSGRMSLGEILPWIFVLHFACFSRHGRIRYPVISAGFVAIGTFVTQLYEPVSAAKLTLVAFASSLLVGSLYGFLGGVASLIGGFVAVRRRARSIHTLSRQQALDRLFEIKERLDKIGPQLDRSRKSDSWINRAHSDPAWPLISLIGGLALGALRVLVLGGYQHLFPGHEAGEAVYTAFRVFSMVFTGLGFLGLGFLAGNIPKAVACQFLAYAGVLATNFIHVGGFGAETALQHFQIGALLSVSPLLLISGLLSGAGAQIEVDAQKKKMVERDDPASLVAEMVLLQRRLNFESTARCVLSVDVARSTAMKSGADPLVVEWSFREYQNLVQACATDAGGHVLSTAGDGAVLVFAECVCALQCSREIQTRLSWFNLRVNRLDSPFRVRIGLHTDEVQGELEDVQFTHVIDLAAHIQSHAPMGGILVSASVAKQLPEEQLVELKEPIEGQVVFLVVSPTLGA